jgi:MinD-like ATPase involved in chromosome partitioning or flagellar assembly
VNATPTPGRIITFYSYKGGVGRTMALANVAWILASNGLRVLTVDWDLEAPGLHRYFHPFLVDSELTGTTGVLDMIWDYSIATLDTSGDPPTGWHRRYADVRHHVVTLDWSFATGGHLSLLAAGRQDDAYATKVNGFDWSNFYNRRNGGAFIEAMKASMRANYDYVLVDSRTGFSDTAGICTVQLPDILVNCFTFSTQGITGAAAVARAVNDQRGHDPIRIWPVPMRVEPQERSRLEISRDLARERMNHLLADLTATVRDRYWLDVEVPYSGAYAYEEVLATIGDRPHEHGSILAPMERLTSVLTEGAVTELTALPEVERRSLAARFLRRRADPRPDDYTLDFVILATAADEPWAAWIASELEEAGFRVFLPSWDTPAGTDFVAHLQRAVVTARRTVAVVSAASLRSTRWLAELDGAEQAQTTVSEPSPIVPIRVEEVSLPASLSRIAMVDLAGQSEREARARLLDAVSLGRAKPTRLPEYPPAAAGRPVSQHMDQDFDPPPSGTSPAWPPVRPR